MWRWDDGQWITMSPESFLEEAVKLTICRIRTHGGWMRVAVDIDISCFLTALGGIHVCILWFIITVLGVYWGMIIASFCEFLTSVHLGISVDLKRVPHLTLSLTNSQFSLAPCQNKFAILVHFHILFRMQNDQSGRAACWLAHFVVACSDRFASWRIYRKCTKMANLLAFVAHKTAVRQLKG